MADSARRKKSLTKVEFCFPWELHVDSRMSMYLGGKVKVSSRFVLTRVATQSEFWGRWQDASSPWNWRSLLRPHLLRTSAAKWRELPDSSSPESAPVNATPSGCEVKH